MRTLRLFLITALTMLLVATSGAQPPPAGLRVLLPIVQQPGVTLEYVATLEMPFETYNAVQPIAIQADSAWWYIVVYRGGDHAGAWLVRWLEGQTTVEMIGGIDDRPGLVEPIPGGPYSDARGSISCSKFGKSIYYFSWQGTSKLVVHRLRGDTC